LVEVEEDLVGDEVAHKVDAVAGVVAELALGACGSGEHAVEALQPAGLDEEAAVGGV